MRGLAIAVVLATGCGTYSMMRPATTLAPGHAEVAAGMAASQLGEANTILHAAVGVTDHVEVLGQNETWNSFVEGRYGVVRQTDGAPLSVAVGVGGGYAFTLLSALTSSGEHEHANGGALTASVAVGHDWGNVALTLGNRTFWLDSGYIATSTRLGVRVKVAGPFGIEAEAGATVHTPTSGWAALTIGEGSGAFFLQW